MELRNKLRRFLRIWLGILGILLAAAVIVHWSGLKAAVTAGVTGAIGAVTGVVIAAAVLITLLRALFPRR